MEEIIIEIIENIVCKKYDVRPTEIRQRTRVNTYLLPRQVVMGVYHDIIGKKNIPALTERYGLDRTTYYNSYKKAHYRCTNKEFSAIYETLKTRCQKEIRASGFSGVLS